MRKLFLTFAVVVTLVLPAAASGFVTDPNPHLVANCEANIDKQAAKGVSAGGGPKAGTPAPTNCDHYYQGIGAIGHS